MEIILDISRHCIETASKREYERMVRQCFNLSDHDTTDRDINIIEKRISALKYLLENADFSDLRNQCTAAGPDEKQAILVVSQKFKDLIIRLSTTTLYPAFKDPIRSK